MPSIASPARTIRSVWLGPLVSAFVLAFLFVVATLFRRSAWADEARPFMVGLSSAAAAIITLQGARTAAARRGWSGVIAGALMILMGIYTLVHVLR
ncbi:hypothetical protein OO015_12145 [Thermomicrobium sp. 4228-Ro]|uniref:hypothetical protein n=1 Tax=Thermomicrobium sp. 4228-Ro TaxID=2993937 RepID=UPI0022494BD5|nr:hypothetical protein [Thermomicrobium sp. 4228-Ro]MCX2728241.1 hypothetical protein [Thermomicrobium sp. 4228-Ro]